MLFVSGAFLAVIFDHLYQNLICKPLNKLTLTILTSHLDSNWIKSIAKAGFMAKGLVYSLVGLLAIMSAFHLGGQKSENSDQTGVFKFIEEQPAGKIILLIVAIGLLCYSIYRFIQTFLDTEKKGTKMSGLAKRFTYFFSSATYLFISFLAFKVFADKKDSGGGNTKQDAISTLLQEDYGKWLLIAAAIIIAGIGLYQIWYGNSEKYKKHIDTQKLGVNASRYLLRAGKVGYIARGIVWLIISFLFFKATMNGKPSEAGSTSSAFSFIQDASYGTYLLAALGLGLICYGVFNFVRAAYEKFKV